MTTNGSEPDSIWRQVANAFGSLFMSNHREMITVLRQPTPIKWATSVTANAAGNVGPTDIFICPISQEAWVNRISISSPSGTPKAPLTTGEIVCTGGSGELQFFLPVAGSIAPIQITEGRLSAIHLNSGGKMTVVGDSFTPGTLIRFDLQITLVTGVSEYTPRADVKQLMDIMP